MTAHTPQISTALSWLGRQIFNQPTPSAYFTPILEVISPMLVRSHMPAMVLGVHEAARNTKTFILKPARNWKGFQPGQHLSLTVEINGTRHTRTFSLSSPPAQWREKGLVMLTVKRLPGGLVTNWMHDHLQPGDVVSVGAAFGEFLLPETPQPLLYIAGGSGITPILSHLATLEQAGHAAPVTLLYYVRTEGDIIGADILYRLCQRLPGFTLALKVTGEGQSFTAEHLPPAEALKAHHCYLCGPLGLMDLASGLLQKAGVPERQISTTYFSAPKASLDTDALGGPVAFSRSGRNAITDGQSSLLEVAEGAGLTPKHGCRMGICHQCSCTKREGTVINRLTGNASGPGEETIQLCISVPRGAVDVDI